MMPYYVAQQPKEGPWVLRLYPTYQAAIEALQTKEYYRGLYLILELQATAMVTEIARNKVEITPERKDTNTMTQSHHTKGPWTFDGYDTITTDGLTIAHLNAQEIENNPALPKQLGPLLAAAPEMLNALHYVRQHLKLTISDIKDGIIDAVLFPREMALEKIEAAIAKAEGVTPYV